VLPYPESDHSGQNKVENCGIFLGAKKETINEPSFTTHPPQKHHKNTTLYHQVFPKPPSKTAISPPGKKKIKPAIEDADCRRYSVTR
jgi:hypothetical protein